MPPAVPQPPIATTLPASPQPPAAASYGNITLSAATEPLKTFPLLPYEAAAAEPLLPTKCCELLRTISFTSNLPVVVVQVRSAKQASSSPTVLQHQHISRLLWQQCTVFIASCTPTACLEPHSQHHRLLAQPSETCSAACMRWLTHQLDAMQQVAGATAQQLQRLAKGPKLHARLCTCGGKQSHCACWKHKQAADLLALLTAHLTPPHHLMKVAAPPHHLMCALSGAQCLEQLWMNPSRITCQAYGVHGKR